MRLSRSSLRGLGTPPPRRLRPWWRRRIAILVIVALASLVAMVALRELLPPTGIGWAIYALHDNLWVPFWSLTWFRAGPWSLLWWVPLLVLVLLEALGLAQPLRALQVELLRRLCCSRFARGMLTVQQRLGWQNNHEGLLVAVVQSELARARHALRDAIAHRRPAPVRAATQLALLLAYLRAADPATQMLCLETTWLIDLSGSRTEAGALREQLEAIWPPEVTVQTRAVLEAAAPELLATLRSPATSAPVLAVATLAVSQEPGPMRPDELRDWFQLWAQLRHQAHAPQPQLGEAEALIDFEFWAARAERRCAATEVSPDRRGWLASLLPLVPVRRSLGEIAALGQDEV